MDQKLTPGQKLDIKNIIVANSSNGLSNICDKELRQIIEEKLHISITVAMVGYYRAKVAKIGGKKTTTIKLEKKTWKRGNSMDAELLKALKSIARSNKSISKGVKYLCSRFTKKTGTLGE